MIVVSTRSTSTSGRSPLKSSIILLEDDGMGQTEGTAGDLDKSRTGHVNSEIATGLDRSIGLSPTCITKVARAPASTTSEARPLAWVQRRYCRVRAGEGVLSGPRGGPDLP